MADTPFLSERGVDENKGKDLFNNNNDEQLTFRNKPIKWTIQDTYKTIITDNVFSTEPEAEEQFTGRKHFISYEGQEYTREQFLKAHFEDYKKHKYKVKFNNDNVFWLGSNQRAKLQYHILSLHFPLAEVSGKDKR